MRPGEAIKTAVANHSGAVVAVSGGLATASLLAFNGMGILSGEAEARSGRSPTAAQIRRECTHNAVYDAEGRLPVTIDDFRVRLGGDSTRTKITTSAVEPTTQGTGYGCNPNNKRTITFTPMVTHSNDHTEQIGAPRSVNGVNSREDVPRTFKFDKTLGCGDRFSFSAVATYLSKSGRELSRHRVDNFAGTPPLKCHPVRAATSSASLPTSFSYRTR